jgi:hypothetical protein
MRARLSRDCYDLCRMAAHPTGKKAIADFDMLTRVVNHKRTYFKSAWANYETAMPGSMHLVPPHHRLAALRADYRLMQEMFTVPPPSFEEILNGLRSIEEALNGK